MGGMFWWGEEKIMSFPATFDQPRPARTEPGGRRRIELLLELIEAAEGAGNRLRQSAARLAAAARAHDLPEHGVVYVAAAVVAHGGADILRHDRAVIGEQ